MLCPCLVSPKVQAPPSHQVYWIHTSAGEDKAVLRAQSRMQKSRLSRKGFSAAGTGVTSGSSLACVSQKARSSAAACDTCRRGVEMQLTRPNDLVPGGTPKSPPRILTTPYLTTPPGRAPPSHSFPGSSPNRAWSKPPLPPTHKRFPPRVCAPSCDRCSLPASAAPRSCELQRF